MQRRVANGFTLLELLVVMVIIGVLASMVGLTVGGRATDDRMQAESQRLEELLRLASDEAQSKGLELGFRQTLDGFEFMSADPATGAWEVVGEGSFRPRTIPEPFALELRIEGRLIKPLPTVAATPAREKKAFDNEASKKADETRNEPQVLILSTGEMTAFTLDLKLKGVPRFYRIEGNAMGELSSGRREVRT